MGCIALLRCVLVVRCSLAGVMWCGIRVQAEALDQPAPEYHTTPELLRMDVLTSEKC